MSPWKKTFYAAWVAQVFSIMGFAFVLPFFPLYIRYLGIEGDSQVAWWAGIVGATGGFTMTIFQPIWGHFADRLGRKVMVLRAMFGGALALALMAYCRNVGDLVLMRIVQGALSGTITASTALVASVAPQRHTGRALGMMQAAVFAGSSVGPLLGGMAVDHLGFRGSFLLAACVLSAGGLLVRFVARESFTPIAKEKRRSHGSFAAVFAAAGFAVAVLVLFQIQFASTAPQPIFVLFVEKLNATDFDTATITGILLGIAGVVAAISAGLLGRLGDRWGHKRLLVVCMLLAGAASVPQAFVTNLWQLVGLRLVLGVAAGGIMPSANAIIRTITHRHNLGKAYGVTASASSLGLAFGPLAGGFVAKHMGLTAPFILTGVMFALTALLVTRRTKQRTTLQ